MKEWFIPSSDVSDGVVLKGLGGLLITHRGMFECLDHSTLYSVFQDSTNYRFLFSS